MEEAMTSEPMRAVSLTLRDAPAHESFPLTTLLRNWQERGLAVPVAVVVSVFDDILSRWVPGRSRQDVLADAVRIDPKGFAFLDSPSASVDKLYPLLGRALGRGVDADDAVPPGGRVLLGWLHSEADVDRPRDAKEFRSWLREALGTPASREEMQDCMRHALDPESESETLRPVPVPRSLVSEDEDDAEAVTLPPQSVMAGPEIDAAESTDEFAQPEPLTPSMSSSGSFVRSNAERAFFISDSHIPSFAESDSDRRVVRKAAPFRQKPVSVGSAPAARQSAQPMAQGIDALFLPNDRRSSGVWWVIAAVAVGVIYLLAM
jgi:hypothetical protein